MPFAYSRSTSHSRCDKMPPPPVTPQPDGGVASAVRHLAELPCCSDEDVQQWLQEHPLPAVFRCLRCRPSGGRQLASRRRPHASDHLLAASALQGAVGTPHQRRSGRDRLRSAEEGLRLFPRCVAAHRKGPGQAPAHFHLPVGLTQPAACCCSCCCRLCSAARGSALRSSGAAVRGRTSTAPAGCAAGRPAGSHRARRAGSRPAAAGSGG